MTTISINTLGDHAAKFAKQFESASYKRFNCQDSDKLDFSTRISLVFIHGWAMHSKMWGDFAAQLSQDYQVTLIELPSSGDLNTIGDAIVAQLSSAEPFYLLGWSLGGTIALDIAARYSNRVRGVILIAANPHFIDTENWTGMPLDTFEAFEKQLHANPDATLQHFLALQLYGLPKFLKKAKNLFAIKPIPELSDLETSLALLKNSDSRAALKSAACPIIAIMSDNDALIPVSVGEQMQSLQPNSRLTILKNAGHIPFITQPENCLNTIHIFLNESR